jgi:hypothetical protein
MLSRLPEGDGIAARYPGDKGIERDPAVVFADDFETTAAGPLPHGYRKRDEKLWDNSGGDCRITEEPENVHSGMKALQMTIVRPGSGQPGGAGVDKYFEEGFDTLFLRYYAKFDKDNDLYHGGAHNGGCIDARAPGMPWACPGMRADGSNKFTVLLDTWRTQEQVPSPGYLVTYVYHMDQGGRWGDQFFPSGRVFPGERDIFGEEFVSRPDFVPPQGRWCCYEVMVHANAPGVRDGRVAFWVDGKVVADFPNLRLRNVATLKSGRIQLGIYTHNPRVQRDIVMCFDDVVAGTSYIGPQAAGG